MKVLSIQETNQVVGGFFFCKIVACVVSKFCGYKSYTRYPAPQVVQPPAVKPPVKPPVVQPR